MDNRDRLKVLEALDEFEFHFLSGGVLSKISKTESSH